MSSSHNDYEFLPNMFCIYWKKKHCYGHSCKILVCGFNLIHWYLTSIKYCHVHFAGPKPSLGHLWFCATVFLFVGLMLAMTDLWVFYLTSSSSKYMFYFSYMLLVICSFKLHLCGQADFLLTLICAAVDCYCCSFSCCKVRGSSTPFE